MLVDFGYVGLFLLVGIGFALTAILLPVSLRFLKVVPHNPNPVKASPFECGVETIGKTWVQFNFRYYYYALVFLVIDVLVVFLYPWAVSLGQFRQAGTGVSSLVAIFVLIGIVIVGYVYAWKKNVLEWK